MDAKSILDALKRASAVDVFLVSFFLLPFVFDEWNRILEDLGFYDDERLYSLIVLFILYCIALIVMLIGTSRIKRRELAKDQIIGYLTSKELEMMSNSGIKQYINAGYSEDFIASVVSAFPSELRHATLRGGALGVARVLDVTAA